MIGRTNIPFGVSGAVDGVTIADLPTHLSSLTAAANSGKVVLTLEYSDTDFVSGVDVLYKTGSFPASPTDGECVTASGAVTEITVEGLANGTKYFFRVYLYRLIGGVKYYQTDETNAKIYATPSAVGISGIEPKETTENYILIDQSGAFSLDIPENLTVTAYVVGGGCEGKYGSDERFSGNYGGYGGGVETVNIPTGTHNCVVTVGDKGPTIGSQRYCSPTTSSLSLDGTTHTTSTTGLASSGSYTKRDGQNGTLTAYGYVGSSGGQGGYNEDDHSNSNYSAGGKGGIGAGDGGDVSTYGDDGRNATNYGCGGGGGGNYTAYSEDDEYGGLPGIGMQGCLIIEWA